jgi:hypothetical protein
MNKLDPTIKDMYYSANIIKDHNIDLLHASRKIKIHTSTDSINSLKFSKTSIDDKNNKSRYMYFNPPMGPLPQGSQCTFITCRAIGPMDINEKVYHTNDCKSPFKEFLKISDEGKISYDSKIKKYYNSKNIPTHIKYLTIFPNRGLQPSNIKKSQKITLDNLITLLFRTKPISTNETYSSTSFNIVIRLSTKSSLYILSAPYMIPEYNIENLGKSILTTLQKEVSEEITPSTENSFITTLKGNYNVFDTAEYRLNLTELDTLIKENINRNSFLQLEQENGKKKQYAISNYKFLYNLSLISFNLDVEKFKVYVEIRIRGNVKILVSKGTNTDRITHAILEKVSRFLKPFFLHNEKTLSEKIPESIININKIHNIIKPKEYTRKGDIQPQVCNGKNRTKPYPYSFRGLCPNKYEDVDEEGMKWLGTGRSMTNFDYFEPCCKKITGVSDPSVRFNDTTRIEKQVDRALKNIGKKGESYKEIINNSDGNKKIYLRRLIYGFPNKMNEDDSHIKHKIEINEQNNYIDNKAATYVPGTENTNSPIRETRVFKGLLQLLSENKERTIEHIVKCYYSSYVETTPFTIDDIPDLVPIFVLTRKDNISSFVMIDNIPKNGIYTKLVIIDNNIYIVDHTGKKIIWGPQEITTDISLQEKSNSKLNKLILSGIWEESTFYPIDIIRLPDEFSEPLNIYYLNTGEDMGSTNRNTLCSEYSGLISEQFSQFFNVSLLQASTVTDSNINKMIDKLSTSIFISTDKTYTDTKLFTWSYGIEQDYFGSITFDFQIEKIDVFKGTCNVMSEDKKLDYISSINIGVKASRKLEIGKYYQFAVEYKILPSGIRKVSDLKNPIFELILSESIDTYDSLQETNYKLSLLFDPLEKPVLEIN